jgi:hypothetical protein
MHTAIVFLYLAIFAIYTIYNIPINNRYMLCAYLGFLAGCLLDENKKISFILIFIILIIS